MKKRILFLGAANFQLPPINYAVAKGYEVITCDNRPENPGHKLALRHYNISTLDRESILALARKENIDAVLTYGSDVSAPAAAYVAEHMSLPGNPLSAVEMLVNKNLFRKFLHDRGIQDHCCGEFSRNENNAVRDFLERMRLPAVVKPVDSSGSKGVGIIDDLDNFREKVDLAFRESFSGRIIIESFIPKQGKQVCGDGFVQNGKLVFVDFGDGHFYDDGKHLAPWGETFPSTHDASVLRQAREKADRIISASGFRLGPINIDLWITQDGEPFINEIGPRSGGNYIPKATLLNTNVDMIAGAVQSALDSNFCLNTNGKRNNSYFSCYMVHSKEQEGKLKSITISDKAKRHLTELNSYVEPEEQVFAFYKANHAIANVILRFNSFSEMNDFYARDIHQHFQVELN